MAYEALPRVARLLSARLVWHLGHFAVLSHERSQRALALFAAFGKRWPGEDASTRRAQSSRENGGDARGDT